MKTDKNGRFGRYRAYYNNFAAHLLNAYNPNMYHPGMPWKWSDSDWFRCMDMIADFGFNVFEFWLEPRLFCRAGLSSEAGKEFARQMGAVISHCRRLGVKTEMICGLATSGPAWHTLCPNEASEWKEIRFLWEEWLRRLPELDIVGIVPGDPGACSRNGCTALTYIDKSLEIALLVRRLLPKATVEFNTWGPPFFGWGNIKGPPGWKGEFIQEYQHTAWEFDPVRAETSMKHLLKRLPEFPDGAFVAINMGFNPDGNPSGGQDARQWAREIAKTRDIITWDFSLTEGENNVIPHWRFERLFARRREEQAAAPYSGGICFTMTPLLNQLSLYESAQSFLRPDADPSGVADEFFGRLYGGEGLGLAGYMPLFEVVKDWGNYIDISLPRDAYHRRMRELAERLADLGKSVRGDAVFHPAPSSWHEEFLFFARLFRDLSAPTPDYDALRDLYWSRVYSIYDRLPEHVDPRPRAATERLVRAFLPDNWPVRE